MNQIRVRLIIEGRVQGVWFRDSTRREASRLSVSGWVRNSTDGSVEVLATGQNFPFDIAVDAEAVYWTSEIDAGVSKVAL